MGDEAVEIYSVDEALESMGFGKFQYLVLLYAGIGWISEAMEVMLLSFIGPAVKSEWSLTSEQESLITTVVFAGMLIGAYSWGLVSDTCGRRKGILATAIVTFAAGLLSAFAPNYIALIAFRGVVGIGLGGAPVLLSWFLEFTPALERGSWMVIFQAFWSVGAIAEAGLAWIVMPRLGWRWLVGVSALPSLLLLVFYTMVPESPRYLCYKGEKHDAVQVLDKAAKLNETALPPGALFSDQEIEHFNSLALGYEQLSPGMCNEAVTPSKWKETDMGAFHTLSMLVSPQIIRSTLLLWVVFYGNSFLYYGLVLLTTELNSTTNTCNPMQVVSRHYGAINYKNVFLTSFSEVPGLVLSAVLVDRIGRKGSMASMFFTCCIFMLPLVVHQPEVLTTSLLFGARACIITTFTISHIYALEVYPTSVRTTGVGVASSIGRIGGMVCPLVAIGLVHGCHQTAVILLFLSVALVSGICVLLFPLETKGLGLSDSVSSNKHEKPDDEKPLLA